MSDRKCARMLLEAARRDIEVLRLMARTAEGSDEVFGFHTQQAVEKSLKAWIALLGDTYPLTHDIRSLLDRLEAHGLDMDPWRGMARFTPFAVAFRYDSVDPDSDPICRARVLARAVPLWERVRAALREGPD